MGVSQTARSRTVGIDTNFKVLDTGSVENLAQRIALIAQGNSASTFTEGLYNTVTSAEDVAAIAGYGSPAHLMALELWPEDGRESIQSIPCDLFLMDDAVGAVAAAGSISASGTQTADEVYTILIGGIPTADFTITSGTVATAAITQMKAVIDAVLNMPVTTSAPTAGGLTLPITMKWAGETGNDVDIEIVGDVAGINYTIVQPTGGATNPDIDDMLDLIVTTWYTIILNGVAPYTDTATLTKISNFGEGRWGELVKAPCFCLNGTVDNYATRTVITDARPLDRTNVLIPVVGSNNIPFVIAARAAERIAVTANDTPATGYKGLLDGINPGTDAEQETFAVLDAGMKKGSCNTVLYNGVVQLNDVVTMYHPTGVTNPVYRYVVTIVKLQNILNGLRTVLEDPEITALPLLPDSAEVVSQQDFMRPRDFVTKLSNLAEDQFSEKLLLAEAEYTQNALKTNVIISSTNPNRVDIKYPVKLSGNVEIISADLNFSFYYGV